MAALFPGSRYYVALSNYLTEPHEKHLLSAQELGRELVARDVPPEEIGALHDDAMARLTSRRSASSSFVMSRVLSCAAPPPCCSKCSWRMDLRSANRWPN